MRIASTRGLPSALACDSFRIGHRQEKRHLNSTWIVICIWFLGEVEGAGHNWIEKLKAGQDQVKSHRLHQMSWMDYIFGSWLHNDSHSYDAPPPQYASPVRASVKCPVYGRRWLWLACIKCTPLQSRFLLQLFLPPLLLQDWTWTPTCFITLLSCCVQQTTE